MSIALSFIGGLIVGAAFTYLWSQLSKSKNPETEVNEIEENNYSPETYLGPNKLILVVRNDLKMGKGKVAAQCSHAAVLAYDLCREKCPYIFEDWKSNGQPKIVVKVNNEREMFEVIHEAQNLELLVSIVHDAGRTQVSPGTRTVTAIGPGPEALVNRVTGHLKLY